MIHKRSFIREKKERTILDRIKVDHTTSGPKTIIHEVKKSRAHTYASKLQLLFYLYELEKLGIECSGQLHFRQERRKETITLDDDSRDAIENAMLQIKEILTQNSPPNPEKVKSCRKCAYHDYCWG